MQIGKCLASLIGTLALAPALALAATDNGNTAANGNAAAGNGRTPLPGNPQFFYFEEDWLSPRVPGGANLDVVTFAKGNASLSSEQKDKLRNTIQSLRASGPVRDAYVAVYADRLRQGNQDLPESNRKLVREREKAIRNFLEDDFSLDVITFNMAERPGWWARLWNTESAKAQAQGSTGDWVADLLRDSARPSSATVVFTQMRHSGLAE